MREICINTNEAGQRFDKYLAKYLKNAPKSFIYKMLRKKNITLNGKKASGSEKLVQGDMVKMFLSEDTICKFSKPQIQFNFDKDKKVRLDIVYEDENVIVVNKPAGMLTQKAAPNDVSLNEYILEYLLETGKITLEGMKTFKPSVCNRLDRNTSGLVIAGCSLAGLQVISELLKNRTIDKYYYCIVDGVMREKTKISGYLSKDEITNKVTVTKNNTENSSYIETYYEPVKDNGRETLLLVKLITGKPHQIRAHLAWIGHPIAGDYKYGNRTFNQLLRDKYGCTSQLLHAGVVHFPDIDGEMSYLSGIRLEAKIPCMFKKVKEGEFG